MTSLQQEHDWLVEHHSEAERHSGRWIAILEGKIVAEGRSYEQAHRKAIKAHAGAVPLVTYVPRKDEELLILLGAV
jgi:hypothetical protein